MLKLHIPLRRYAHTYETVDEKIRVLKETVANKFEHFHHDAEDQNF